MLMSCFSLAAFYISFLSLDFDSVITEYFGVGLFQFILLGVS